MAEMENTATNGYDLRQRLNSIVNRFWVWGVCSACLILFMHWPFDAVPLTTDDYLISTSLQGNSILAEKGFSLADPARAWTSQIADAFHFFSASRGTTETYREYGNLVWWSSSDGLMNPFRPMAAMTHWLDFNVLDADPLLLRVHSLVYLLLMWGAAALLYRRFLDPMIALLGAAFLVFDFSVSMNFEWLAARNSYMAVGWGLLTVFTFSQWRSGAGILRLLCSLLLYVAALLTAEASIAILGYLGAYALTMDKKGWFKGCLAVIPYLLITLIWRVAYSGAGYGADNIGLYADPGRGLLQFLEQLVLVYPCIVASIITGFDGMISPFSPSMQWAVRGVAWATTLLSLYCVKDLLRDKPVIRFMLIGSALAAIPHASLLSAGSRSGTFVAIGFFFVLAVWVNGLWQRRAESMALRMLTLLIVTWHLCMPVLLGSAKNYLSTHQAPAEQTAYSSVVMPLNTEPRSLVTVNHPWSAKLFYLPFEWVNQGLALPLSVNALSPGLSRLEISRISQRSFVVRSFGEMAVDHEVDIRTDSPKGQPWVHTAYIYQMLQGLVTSPKQHYEIGMIFLSGNMQVKILALKNGKPTKVQVDFVGDESPDHMAWQWFDWQGEEFKSMPVPKIGDSVEIPGPFDIAKVVGF